MRNHWWFDYKWTFAVSLFLLGALLWSGAMGDGLSFVVAIVSLLCFAFSAVASIVQAIFERSRASVVRVGINAAVCLIFFPTISLGQLLRSHLFLARLGHFQEATNLLIKDEAGKGKSSVLAQLPPGFSDLHVADSVLIRSDGENVSISYLSQDSSALGHRGFMYRTDDDPVALKKEFPRLGYTRVAPHWFSFSD